MVRMNWRGAEHNSEKQPSKAPQQLKKKQAGTSGMCLISQHSKAETKDGEFKDS